MAYSVIPCLHKDISRSLFPPLLWVRASSTQYDYTILWPLSLLYPTKRFREISLKRERFSWTLRDWTWWAFGHLFFHPCQNEWCWFWPIRLKESRQCTTQGAVPDSRGTSIEDTEMEEPDSSRREETPVDDWIRLATCWCWKDHPKLRIACSRLDDQLCHETRSSQQARCFWQRTQSVCCWS